MSAHPEIRSVRLVGSRAEGRARPTSDWDFAVETIDFPRAAAALTELVAPLEPLVAHWDRLSDSACFMLILAGPTKVDLIFPDQPHVREPPWRPSRSNLVDVYRHFWDWMLWLSGKASRRQPRPRRRRAGEALPPSLGSTRCKETRDLDRSCGRDLRAPEEQARASLLDPGASGRRVRRDAGYRAGT